VKLVAGRTLPARWMVEARGTGLVITVISHGKADAVDSIEKLHNGISHCTSSVYEFTNARVPAIKNFYLG
jgi:hypothetical protein